MNNDNPGGRNGEPVSDANGCAHTAPDSSDAAIGGSGSNRNEAEGQTVPEFADPRGFDNPCCDADEIPEPAEFIDIVDTNDNWSDTGSLAYNNYPIGDVPISTLASMCWSPLGDKANVFDSAADSKAASIGAAEPSSFRLIRLGAPIYLTDQVPSTSSAHLGSPRDDEYLPKATGTPRTSVYKAMKRKSINGADDLSSASAR